VYELSQVVCQRDGFRLQVEACRLEQGTTYAVVGPNGSGKTTLLDLLALQGRPTAGELAVAGEAAAWDAPGRLLAQRRRIAYLLQNPYLFSTSVAANIGYGLALRGVGAAERRARVEEMARRLSLEHLLERSAARLSGGEAQRVALARALVLEADAYLLDEPTANVDRQHVERVEELVRETGQQRGATVVLTTHSQEQAYRLSAHHIALIDGRLSDVAYENVLAGELRVEADGVRTVALVAGTELKVAGGEPGPVTVAIDPEDILLSAAPLESSALNRLSGKVRGAEAAARPDAGRSGAGAPGTTLRVYVDVGVTLCARVTARSFRELGLEVGQPVWLTFKATAVRLL